MLRILANDTTKKNLVKAKTEMVVGRCRKFICFSKKCDFWQKGNQLNFYNDYRF